MTDRYQRHALIDWFDQDRLLDARVVVVGAGATGNEVLKNLALLGVGHLRVIDFDKIEEHNLTRSVLFKQTDVGRPKAEVAAEACRGINSDLDVVACVGAAWDVLTLKQVAEADAVISCVDNFESRIDLNRLCLIAHTDFYTTGIDSRFVSVDLHPLSETAPCACYQCQLPASVYDRLAKRYSCGWLRKMELEEHKIPTTTVTSSLAGAAVVSLLLNRLCKHPHAIRHSVHYFQDTVSLGVTVSDIAKNEECDACHTSETRTMRSTANRRCSSRFSVEFVHQDDCQIRLSEAILVATRCRKCGKTQNYLESTRRLTDGVAFCTNCGVESMVLDVVEVLNIERFRQLFGDRNVPCKYITCEFENHRIILELEG